MPSERTRPQRSRKEPTCEATAIRDAVFAQAEDSGPARAERDIMPNWVDPAAARIERHIPVLPLSRDDDRLHRMLRALAQYRSVIGQPRQEDLIAFLQGRLGAADLERIRAALTIRVDP